MCFGEGWTLQTNITGVYSQWFSHTGFAPAYGMYVFPACTAWTPGCSAGNCLKQSLFCMHFPGLSHSGSGSWVLHKGTDLVGRGFVSFPGLSSLGNHVLGDHTLPRWEVHLITTPVPVSWFPGCAAGVPSQVCRVSPLGSWSLASILLEDVNCLGSQEDLVSNWEPTQFVRRCRLWGWVCPSPSGSGFRPPAPLPLAGHGSVRCC